MRTIALAALVVALTTPVWANNEEHPEWEWTKARDVCVKAGGDFTLCAVKHMPERDAVFVAGALLDGCEYDNGNTELGMRFGNPERFMPQYEKLCAEARAYIKQRWGY